MRAIVLKPTQNETTLELREVPEPTAGPNDLLVQVKATAINRADLLARQGSYPTQSSKDNSAINIGGLEAAGQIIGMGDQVQGFNLGDRVMAMCPSSYAEQVVIDHRMAMPIPQQLSFEQAATIAVSYMTEHNALITNGQFQSGETVFINAASSGVGVAAIQLAKLCGAKQVIASSRSKEKLKTLAKLGVDVGIHQSDENIADPILKATNNEGVNVVLDHVGASHFSDHMRALAVKGRLVNIGRLGGAMAEIDLENLALKRIHVIGVTFRTRSLDEKIAITKAAAQLILPAFTDGRLQVIIDNTFPFEQALKAQEYMATNSQVGKIVLIL